MTAYTPWDADIIIVVGCQVTDLAILNDIRLAEMLHKQFPHAVICIGGCLAQRLDVELPEFIRRVDFGREEYEELDKSVLRHIFWEKPFWVSDQTWKSNKDDFSEGNLFRNMYPLKIGAGCTEKCKCCTIRDTRGKYYETDAFRQVNEFLNHDNIVLVSDSPTPKQIRDWITLSYRYKKPISMRNVEPQVALSCEHEILKHAECGLLKIFHCPIQSSDPKLLEIMGRSVESTLEYLGMARELRKLGVKVATDIIIDYEFEGDIYRNLDVEWMDSHFDYWVWNPYFDGKWDRNKAEGRWQKYIK